MNRRRSSGQVSGSDRGNLDGHADPVGGYRRGDPDDGVAALPPGPGRHLREDEPPRPAPSRSRARARRAPPRPVSPFRLALVGVVVALGVLLAFPYALHAYYAGRALPGVTVQGMPVGDLQHDAILAALRARHADFLRQPITLTYGGQTWQPVLGELGVSFDLQATTAAALQPGRQGDPLHRLRDLWLLWQGRVDVVPRLQVDVGQLQAYLLQIASEMNQPPRDAALSISGARVLHTHSVPGLQLLVDATANDVLLELQTLQPQEVPLRTRLLEPVVRNEAMVAAQEQARGLLASPLVLTHGDREWVWDAEKLGDLLRVTAVGGDLQVQVDAAGLAVEVERLAQEIDSGSVEPRLRFVDGGLEVIEPGRQGWRLQQAVALQVISTTLQQARPTTRTLELPTDELYPRITPERLSELGIHQLLAEGRSSFAGSAAYRVTNIQAGAARMDGVLIAPDEEFSFNTQLGAVDSANGFVEGYAIIGNRTRLEWGGGVCQNSTTVFRAAFWAGLPITERHAHPFYISWYDRFGYSDYGDGAGMDATIYTGLQDLKFVNDTGHWLLLQMQVDTFNQVLTVQLYGANPYNRGVKLDGPYVSNIVQPAAAPVYIDDASRPSGYLVQTDVARSGRDITVYRRIFENGVEVAREPFVTRFKAWPNVYVRGTGG